MLGFSCSDPDLRFNFLTLYNRSMSQTPLERLRMIFHSLDWSEIADTFWIKQVRGGRYRHRHYIYISFETCLFIYIFKYFSRLSHCFCVR